MNYKEFEILLQGYLNDELSSADLKLFLQELNNPAHEKLLQSAIDESLTAVSLEELKNKDRIFNSIIQDVVKENQAVKNEETKSSNGKLRSLFFYRAAAAVIVILLGVFAILKITSHKNNELPQSPLATVVEKEIVPGSNKAVLQLADGSTIILDSSSNGNIANQGQTKIIKIDGQLAYNSAGPSSEILYNTISTPRGGQYQLILADGTKVWLNAASSLKYSTNFVGDKRRVELTGEAYFEVAKNAKMPFVVTIAGKEEVEVLGTHFNINAYPDEPAVNTSLLEGKVKVIPLQANIKNAQHITLLPGEQAQLEASGNIASFKNVDMDKVVAWKNNVFNFNNENVESIMRQISRWYDVSIKYEGQIPNVKFSGEIGRNLSLKQVLSILEETRIKYRLEGSNLIISN